MLKVRLQRVGRKNDPHYRVVVIEAARGPQSGNIVECVGAYNPKSGSFQVQAERVQYWIGVGARASDTVHNFLVTQNIIPGKKKNALPKKKPLASPSTT